MLQELCVEVETSESEVQTLLDQIDTLKKSLCSKISQSTNIDLDPHLNTRPGDTDLDPETGTNTLVGPDPEPGISSLAVFFYSSLVAHMPPTHIQFTLIYVHVVCISFFCLCAM